MRYYHLDCGNSTHGPVGLCGRVRAKSKRDALNKARSALRRVVGTEQRVTLRTGQPGIDYMNVYISPENIRLSDIDED